MKTRRKRWSEMATRELAEATKQFDDPTYHPPAVKPTARQLQALGRARRKAKSGRSSVPVVLEKQLIDQADDYAVTHGLTFSELVSDALRRLIRKPPKLPL